MWRVVAHVDDVGDAVAVDIPVAHVGRSVAIEIIPLARGLKLIGSDVHASADDPGIPVDVLRRGVGVVGVVRVTRVDVGRVLGQVVIPIDPNIVQEIPVTGLEKVGIRRPGKDRRG